MRSWVNWTGAAAFVLLAGSAVAADHGDGPAASASPEADINDVYAWVGGDGNLKLIMTVGGLSAPTDFDKDVVYVFNVTRHDDAIALATTGSPGTTTKIMCTFASNTDASCWIGDKDYVTGDPSASAGIQSTSGNTTFHAGAHADPFFIYLIGLNNAIAEVREIAPNLMPSDLEASGCIKDSVMAGPDYKNSGKTTAEYLVALLTGAEKGPAANNIDGLNSLAIVLSVNKDDLAGTGDLLGVWGSTHAKN